MKSLKKFSLLVVIGTALALAVIGCGEKNTESIDPQMLVVERQYVMLDGASPNGWDQAEFVVDVPMKGPQPLLDSIKVFLNKTLYDRFEIGDEDDFDFKLFKSSEVYTDDMPNLLSSYADKYRAHLKKNLGWFVTNNIFLIAQTESFVTYGVECYHGSGSTGSEFWCHTFNKKDGRRVRNIITWEDILRFVNEHPKAEHPFYEWNLNTNREYKFDNYDAGLLHDGLLLVNEDAANHYQPGKLAYEEVLPYLSEQAQSLVKSMGISNKWKDCFMGERFATINTKDKQVLVLTARPAKHDWAEEGYYDVFLSEDDEYGLTSNLNYIHRYGGGDLLDCGGDLMAFYAENGRYTPANVFDGDSVMESHWDELNSTNPAKDVYVFDSTNNKLYVPSAENVMMGHHACNDRYDVFRYNELDGFVYEGEDGGFWLHPSLREFGRLLYAGKTDDYLVRIDEMRIYDDRYDDQYEAACVDTCRYRYAAWKNKGGADEPDYNMLDEPDLVIDNGYWNDGFVFENNGHTYKVIINPWVSEPKPSVLKVYHKGKLILEQQLYDLVMPSD